MTRVPVLRKPNEGRTIAVVGDVYRFLVTGEDTNGNYALIEALVPPGGGPPPHVHSREEEGFYILEGEITFTVNGEKIVAQAGTFANMPVGTPHSFKNECDRPAKMLISVAPPGLEQMFLEVGVPLVEGATTALPPTREELEKLLAIAPLYGIEIKLPERRRKGVRSRFLEEEEKREEKRGQRRKGVRSRFLTSQRRKGGEKGSGADS